MSLRVWLPLNGNLDNQGLDDITVTNHGATVDNSGKIGKCYSFGTSTSYLTLSNDAMNKCTTECSLSFWLNITSWNTSYATYFQAGLGGAPWTHYVFGVLRNASSTNLCFTISNGSSSSQASYTTPALSLNTWYHLTFVYKTGHCLIYINGELYKDYTTTIVPNFSGITKTTVGVCNSGGYQTNCKLNDVRIYDHALSPREVELLSRGLVAHYPLNGGGRGQDNLLKNSNFLQGTNGMEGYTATGATCTKQSDCMKVVSNGASSGFYTSNFNSITTGVMTTFSAYVKADSTMTIYIGTDGSGNGSCQAYTIGTNWQRISISKEKTTNNANLRIYGQGTFYAKLLKYELGSIATPWMPNSADTAYTTMGYNSTTEYDVSGNGYNGTKTKLMDYSSNTAKYSVSTIFDGGNDSIRIPFYEMLGSRNDADYTVSVWTYKDVIGTDNYQTILGGQSGFELEARNSSATDPLYKIYNWGGGTTSYEFGKWTHFCFVRTASDSKLYVNGVLKLNGTAGTIPSGNYYIGSWRDTTSQNFEGKMSDFRIYATALSDTQVAELYNTAVSVANNGTLMGYELVEV